MTRYDNFFSFINSKLEHFKLDSVLLVSHLDTDGITSLSLLKKFYEDKDYELKIIPQLDEECINDLAAHEKKNIILLDTGSLKLTSLIEKLSHKEKLIIIDHHEMEEREDLPENLVFINPLLFDINGSKEISTAGITYFILKEIDESFSKYSYLPIVGAFGDYQYQNNFRPLNRIIQQQAMLHKTIVTKKELNIFRLNSQPLKFSLSYSGDFKIPKFYRKERSVISLLKTLKIDPTKSYSQLNENEQRRLVKAVVRVTPKFLRSKLFAYHILINPNLLSDDGYLYEAKEISTFLNGLSRLYNVRLAIDFCLDMKTHFKEVKEENKKYKQEISRAMKMYYDMRDEIFESDELVFVNFAGDLNPNLAGILGSMLTKGGIEHNEKIVAIAAYQNKNLKISFRCVGKLKYDLNKMARYLVSEFGGEAGGHKQAAGAIVKKEHENAIVEKIRNLDCSQFKVETNS